MVLIHNLYISLWPYRTQKHVLSFHFILFYEVLTTLNCIQANFIKFKKLNKVCIKSYKQKRIC